MSISANITTLINIDGIAEQIVNSPQADNAVKCQPTLPAGQAGTITSQSGGTIAIAGCTITEGPVAVFWDGGVRYDCTLADYDENGITVSGGSGDALPADDTPVICSTAVDEDALAIPYADLQALLIKCDQRAFAQLFKSGPTSEFEEEIGGIGQSHFYPSYALQSNPLDGDVIDGKFYNGSTTETTLFLVAALT